MNYTALVTAAASLLCVPAVAAQDLDAQARLAKQREKKLAKPFLDNAAWILDYDEARAAAAKSGKFLLTYFTRSYAP